jgi:hypothetical protein
MHGLSHGLPYGRSTSYTAADPSMNNLVQNDWLNQAGPLAFDHLNRRSTLFSAASEITTSPAVFSELPKFAASPILSPSISRDNGQF